jgi:ABC-type amino acid transport substrate-binding protein
VLYQEFWILDPRWEGRKTMMLRTKKVSAMAGAVAMVAAYGPASIAIAQDAPRVAPPEQLVTPGTLTYGTAATFPPFEYKDPSTGELTGFDIEMMAALADYMGLEVGSISSTPRCTSDPSAKSRSISSATS